jgi:hypothetical protein
MTHLLFQDNHLQIFHALYELVPEVRHELDRLTEDGNEIAEVITRLCLYMQNGDPQMARWQWIRDVMKITPIPGNDINLESSEHSSIGQYFSGLFDLDMIRYCNWCK